MLLSSSTVTCVVFPGTCCFPGPSSFSGDKEVVDTNSIGLSPPGWLLLLTFLANNVLRNEYPLSLVLGDVGEVGLLGEPTLR